MVRLFYVLLFALLSFAPSSFAQSSLPQLFQDGFYSDYRANKCGANILALIDKANAEGIDIRSAHVLEIRNAGYGMFGLVNAEWARGAGPRAPQPDPHGFRFLPGESNWEFHAVLEANGQIYDYDFGNAPSVVPVKDYFERMFLDDKPTGSGGKFHIDRKEKLADYEISVISALDLANHVAKPQEEKIRLGAYLQNTR